MNEMTYKEFVDNAFALAEEDVRLTLENGEDARDRWPARWDRLRALLLADLSPVPVQTEAGIEWRRLPPVPEKRDTAVHGGSIKRSK